MYSREGEASKVAKFWVSPEPSTMSVTKSVPNKCDDHMHKYTLRTMSFILNNLLDPAYFWRLKPYKVTTLVNTCWHNAINSVISEIRAQDY